MGSEAKMLRQLTRGDYEVTGVTAPVRAGEVERVYFTSTEGSPLETHLWTMKLDGSGKRN